MSRYPAYPEYKATGCDWFPSIPAHWQIDRAKWSVSSCQNGIWGSEPEGDDDLVCIRVADFDRQSLCVSTKKLTLRSIAERERRNRLLMRGDLLLEKSGGGEQQLVGAVVEFDQSFPAVSSNFIARMVVKEGMDSRFLVYIHAHLYSGRVNFRSIKQTTGIQNLDGQAYLDERIPYPPLDEQRAITRFLDFKTAQIDALIAKKVALLDKLAEERTTLISLAVTKGLDPLAPRKDSGVAWLGDIPAHWTVSKLAYLSLSLQTGPFGSQLHADEYIEGGVPLINPTDISNGEVLENAKITVGEDVAERLSRHKLELGDVVIARRGEMGRAGLVRERNVGWLCGTGSLRARLDKTALIPEFLLYQFSMRGVAEYLSLQSVGSTMDNLNTSILGRLPVIAPPLPEQAALVLHLRKLSESIDCQVAKVREVISSLHEYRSALITNAVTGRIDVRDFELPPTAEVVAL
jgi:type I restriction enzyme S subunit